MKAPAGYVVYRGASVLDGAPIVMVATLRTSNAKTGGMVQTWILREDMDPLAAAREGADAAVCGACPHRHYSGGACYVTLHQAPLSVWRAYHRGKYPDMPADGGALAGRAIRLGAYGDPAAVPFGVIENLAQHARKLTGYTHQWERLDFDRRILRYCMASVDTENQAEAVGARYFRVKRASDPSLPGEVECLSDSQGLTCLECGVCNGGTKGKSVYINIHGARSSKYAPDIIARA